MRRAGPALVLALLALGPALACSSTAVVSNGPDCTPACASSQLCHPSLLICVACITDAQCNGSKPLCDAHSHACVQCLDDSRCPDATPMCVRGSCQQCAQDADCGSGQVCASGACRVPQSDDAHSGEAGASDS